jgi:alcohol dehydrogenase YqhD (iron-dependent ADH family)
MENFIAHNPTTLHFGRNVCNGLSAALKPFGNRVLLVYGKGSIRRNGLYETIVSQLKENGFVVFEYDGIKSNPVVEDVDAAAAVGKANKVDVILAAGGGSVIDSAKFISIAIPYEGDAWDFVIRKAKPEKAVPLVAILTLAATGTEMNMFAVVQNHSSGVKSGYGHPLLYPRHSFLDPFYTATVPATYTAYGIVDLMAHTLEAYFGQGDASLSDRFAFSILNEAIEYGPKLMKNLDDYDLRARIMWAATCALNGTPMHGRVSGDWGVHSIGHTLSLLFDTPHGASLSIAYPAWMKLMLPRIRERLEFLGRNLFNVSTAEECIDSLTSFFELLGSPVSLIQAGIEPSKHHLILDSFRNNKISGAHHRMTDDDYSKLIDLMK